MLLIYLKLAMPEYGVVSAASCYLVAHSRRTMKVSYETYSTEQEVVSAKNLMPKIGVTLLL